MNPIGTLIQPKAEALLKLKEELLEKPDIISFSSDPKLCSFLSCLGLKFEIENPDWDRLSIPLGAKKRTLKAQMIMKDDLFGLVLTRMGGEEFVPHHPGFAELIDPLSLDESKVLSRIVLFPEKIAAFMQRQGIDLVIIKDWVLDSFLSEGKGYNYQFASEQEMNSQSALRQAQMLSRKQISFSGTHDLVDHLLGLNESKLFQARNYFEKSLDYIQKHSENKVLTYTTGVILDDLAQPKWYGSQKHLDALLALFKLFDSNHSGFDFSYFINRVRTTT